MEPGSLGLTQRASRLRRTLVLPYDLKAVFCRKDSPTCAECSCRDGSPRVGATTPRGLPDRTPERPVKGGKRASVFLPEGELVQVRPVSVRHLAILIAAWSSAVPLVSAQTISAANSPQTVSAPFKITPAAAVPSISAITNAASYSRGGVSPGENVVIFGTGFGPATVVSGSPVNNVFPTLVSNTRVLFDNGAAPIIYAYAGQTSVMVPYGVAGRTTTTIVVEYSGVQSAPITSNVVPAAPGIYTLNAQGVGPGSILNQDGITVNGPKTPEKLGNVVTIYMTGEGQTTPPGADGVVIPAVASALKKPDLAVTVTIGGVDAPVLYAGSAPGLVSGVMQVNVAIPLTAPTGTVPVVVSVGGSSTQVGAAGVTMAVASSGTSNPQPGITSLAPSSATAGAGPLTLTINGTGFLTTSTVTFNGIAHAATFVGANQLTISLSTADLGTAGTFQVVVTNPPPGGGNSQPAAFTVQSASVTPTLQSLALSGATVVGGGSVTGTITLSASAPAGGVQVQVSSNNPIAQVPTFVTLSGGQSSATFTISTTAVTSSQSVTISASLAGVTKTANLAVNAATVTATVIYAGTDSGIYRSSDGGVTWQQSLALGLLQGFVARILVDPAHHANVYAVASDYDGTTYNMVVYRSSDAGQTWVKTKVVANSMSGPSNLAIDPVATNVLYLNLDGIYKSTDSGATWQPTPLASMSSMTADPVTTGVVYANDNAHIYRSSDFGTTWNLLAAFFNFTPTQIVSYVQFPSISTITVDPQNSSTLYAANGGGYCWTGTDEPQCGGIFKSTDGGKTWQDLGLAGSYGNMTIDNNTGAFYAGGSLDPFFGYIVKSLDGGKTWTPINTGLTTHVVNVFLDPGNSSNLYAEVPSIWPSLNGIFRSTNDGGTWTFDPVVASGGQLLSFGIPAR